MAKRLDGRDYAVKNIHNIKQNATKDLDLKVYPSSYDDNTLTSAAGMNQFVSKNEDTSENIVGISKLTCKKKKTKEFHYDSLTVSTKKRKQEHRECEQVKWLRENPSNFRDIYRKRIGVRRLLIKFDSSNSSKNISNSLEEDSTFIDAPISSHPSYEYKYGEDNPLILTLMKNNPAILHRIISTRNPMGMPWKADFNSKSEAGLGSSFGSIDNTYYNDRENIHLQEKTGCVDSKFNSEDHNFVETKDQTYESYNFTQLPAVSSNHSDHQVLLTARSNTDLDGHALEKRDRVEHVDTEYDVKSCVTQVANEQNDIIENDAIFLQDVLEEEKMLQWKRDKRTNAINHECNIHSVTSSSRSSLKIEEDSNNTLQGKKKRQHEFQKDDLIWLTQEMEKEWNDFVENQGSRAIFFDGKMKEIFFQSNMHTSWNDEGSKGKKRKQKRNKHRYRASIMTCKGPRCNLGIFDTSTRAAEEYDKYAIGRRTLGRKLLEEIRTRQRVAARKAAYNETRRALSQDNCMPQRAAILSHKAAGDARAAVNVDEFLVSDKVLFPEINFPGWDTSGTYTSYIPSFWRKNNLDINSFVNSTLIDYSNPIEIANDSIRRLHVLQDLMMKSGSPEVALLDILQNVFHSSDKIRHNKGGEQENKKIDDEMRSPSPSHLNMLLNTNDSLSMEQKDEIISSIEELEQELDLAKTRLHDSAENLLRMIHLDTSIVPFLDEVNLVQQQHVELFSALQHGKVRPRKVKKTKWK